MKTHRVVVAAVAALVLSDAARAGSTIVEPVEPGEFQMSVNGQPLDVPMWRIWSPLCVEGFDSPSEAELAEVVELSKTLIPATPLEPREGGAELGLLPFDIQFNVSGAPFTAQIAIDALEDYLEATFARTLLGATIVINVSFGDLGLTTLGSTSSLAANVSYDFVRDGLRNRADSDDFLNPWVPSGTTFPVRFDGSSGVVTDVGTMTVPCGNIQAAFFASCGGGAVANIVINTNPAFLWDYFPADGVPPFALCFRSVFTHEVGHALGFFSKIDAPAASPSLLDLFRFQGSANNPSTFPQFGTVARVNESNDPDQDQIFDALTFTYALSDGSPNQAGHFQQQNPPIGLMDPDLGLGESFHSIGYFQQSDLRVFDSIGFDLSDAACMSGSVTNVDGVKTPILSVNNKAGWVTVPVGSSVTINYGVPPGGTDGDYVLWVWKGFEFGPGYTAGWPLACTMRPNPISGGSPQPIRCLKGQLVQPEYCAGVFELPSPAVIPFSRSKTLPRAATLTLQGLQDDFGSPNFVTATNAVILQVQ